MGVTVRQLCQAAKRTFNLPKSQRGPCLFQLQKLLDQITPEDLNLVEPDENVPVSMVDGITFLHIYECPEFTVGVFLLAPRQKIPLHDHPKMTVLSKLLYGKLRVRAYDWETYNTDSADIVCGPQPVPPHECLVYNAGNDDLRGLANMLGQFGEVDDIRDPPAFWSAPAFPTSKAVAFKSASDAEHARLSMSSRWEEGAELTLQVNGFGKLRFAVLYEPIADCDSTRGGPGLVVPKRIARLARHEDMVSPCPSVTLFENSGGNIHEFEALTHCAILDILGPPYDRGQGRNCHYFKVTKVLDEEDDASTISFAGERVTLIECYPPVDFHVISGEYSAPT